MTRSIVRSRPPRQWATLLRPTLRIVAWQPMVQAQLAGLAFVALAGRPSADRRLSIAGAIVAATSAFVLDDAAAATLNAVPTSPPRRRLQRVVYAGAAIAIWWSAVAVITTQRGGAVPLVGRALEMCVLVAIALAASAVASSVGDRTSGGIAGAVIVGLCYFVTLLPPWRWSPLPAHPDADGARVRLLVALAIATVVLAAVSHDPARRTRRERPSQDPRQTGR